MDSQEKCHFDSLHKEQVLDINDTAKREGRGSMVVNVLLNITENSINVGKFITLNHKDYSVIHKVQE